MIDVLKIDCEGCEYVVMPPLFELMSSGRVQVDQLLIELHIHLDPVKKCHLVEGSFLGGG